LLRFEVVRQQPRRHDRLARDVFERRLPVALPSQHSGRRADDLASPSVLIGRAAVALQHGSVGWADDQGWLLHDGSTGAIVAFSAVDHSYGEGGPRAQLPESRDHLTEHVDPEPW